MLRFTRDDFIFIVKYGKLSYNKYKIGGKMQVTNINNRRYLGNKYQLLPFINEVISKECGSFESFAEKKSEHLDNELKKN